MTFCTNSINLIQWLHTWHEHSENKCNRKKIRLLVAACLWVVWLLTTKSWVCRLTHMTKQRKLVIRHVPDKRLIKTIMLGMVWHRDRPPFKSMHTFLINVANRQRDRQTWAKTFTSPFVGGNYNCNININHYRQACAKRSHAGIVFTQWSKNGFIAPQGRHVAPINVKFGTPVQVRSPVPNFTCIGVMRAEQQREILTTRDLTTAEILSPAASSRIATYIYGT